LALYSLPEADRNGLIPIFTGIEKAKFKRPVRPGDQLRIEMEYLRRRGDISHLHGKTTVDGELACMAEVRAIFKKKSDFVNPP
jgi:3-hydroxyacyl-[acyl-carrier-protein] dehydratase